MRHLALKLGAVVAAAAVVAAGLAGAYSYGRDYELHRGFTTLMQFRRAGSGRLEDVQFYSRVLHRSADYLVYLPPHYSPRRRYPVYYLLHGAPGQPRVFVDIANMDIRLDNQLSLGHARPMILVYPDGRIGGSTFSDSEWANTPSGNFESYVIEVMHNVDQRFATIPRRQDRVIAGFSAGAYGAMNIALHHLADFADVQSWSGYFTQTRSGVFANASRATLAYNSPLDYISRLHRELARYPLRAYLFVGRADSASAQQLPMARALIAAGAQVQYRFDPGGHDWSVWYPRLNQMLELASRDISHLPNPNATAGLRLLALPTAGQHEPRHPRHRSELGLIGALLLALLSAALINLGFVLQHRGHDRARTHRRATLTSGFHQPVWLLGQAIGWIGFAGQIVAVALAPLTLVQAFSAGSLALSVPLAARIFGHPVTRRQLAAIALIALGLASLPIGFGGAHGQLHPGVLIALALLVMLAAGLLPRGGTAALAVAAGAFYGAADGAIKAASVGLRFHGSGILTGWTVLAGLCTLGGFVAFQAALRNGDAVQSLSLMNAFTALAAIGLGTAAFGERLGSSPATGLLHAAAIIVVLACVRPLEPTAAADAEPARLARARLTSTRRPRPRRFAPGRRGSHHRLADGARATLRAAPAAIICRGAPHLGCAAAAAAGRLCRPTPRPRPGGDAARRTGPRIGANPPGPTPTSSARRRVRAAADAGRIRRLLRAGAQPALRSGPPEPGAGTRPMARGGGAHRRQRNSRADRHDPVPDTPVAPPGPARTRPGSARLDRRSTSRRRDSDAKRARGRSAVGAAAHAARHARAPPEPSQR